MGDELTFSSQQVQEHLFDSIFEVKDPQERLVFVGYETNPELKCKKIEYKNTNCK